MLDITQKNVGYNAEKCWIYYREMIQNDVTFLKMLHRQKKMLLSDFFVPLAKKTVPLFGDWYNFF